MSTAIGDLVVNMRADTTRLQAGLIRSERLIRGATGSVLGLVNAFAPLSGGLLLAGMLRAGERFNHEMRASLAIMGDVSDDLVGAMRGEAIALAAELNYAASEVARGYYYLASAGMTAEQQLIALPAAAQFARAGMMELGRATELASDVLAAMGLRSENPRENLAQLVRVTDVLSRANTLAQASSEQFAIALTTKAATAARVAGVSLEETVAVLAALAQKGIKAERAGSMFEIALRELQRRAVESEQAFKRYNVAVYDSAGNLRPMVEIIRDLSNALGPLSLKQKMIALREMQFTMRSVFAVRALLDTTDAVEKYTKALERAGGFTRDVAERQLGAFTRGLGEFKAAATDAGSDFMTVWGPLLGDFLAASGEMIRLGETWGKPLFVDPEQMNELDRAGKEVGKLTHGARALHAALMRVAWAWAAWKGAASSMSHYRPAIEQARGDFRAIDNEIKRMGREWAEKDYAAVGLSQNAIRHLIEEARKGNDEAKQILRDAGLSFDFGAMKSDVNQLQGALSQFDSAIERIGKTGKKAREIMALEELLEPLRAAGASAEVLAEATERYAEAVAKIDLNKGRRNLSDWQDQIKFFGMGTREVAIRKTLQAALGQTGDKRARLVALAAEMNAAHKQLTQLERHAEAVEFGERLAQQFETPAERIQREMNEIMRLMREFPDAFPQEVGQRALEELWSQRPEAKQLEQYNDMLQQMTDRLNDVRSGASHAQQMVRDFSRTPGATPEQIARLQQLADEIDEAEERKRQQAAAAGMSQFAAAAQWQTTEAYSMVQRALGGKRKPEERTEKNTRKAAEGISRMNQQMERLIQLGYQPTWEIS